LRDFVVYVRYQAFLLGQRGNEINDVKGGGASGCHGYVRLKKNIELLSITIPFHLHHNTCQIRTGLAYTTTKDLFNKLLLKAPAKKELKDVAYAWMANIFAFLFVKPLKKFNTVLVSHK